MLELIGRAPEARASYEEALRLDPSLALAHAALGRILREDAAALELIDKRTMRKRRGKRWRSIANLQPRFRRLSPPRSKSLPPQQMLCS